MHTWFSVGSLFSVLIQIINFGMAPVVVLFHAFYMGTILFFRIVLDIILPNKSVNSFKTHSRLLGDPA